MMHSKDLFAELRLLITEAVEGSATTEQMARLNEILAGSEQARRYYFEFIDIQTLTEHICSEKLFFDEAEEGVKGELRDQQMLLDALAQEEKQANTIPIEKVERPLEKIIVHRMDVVKNPWKINKSSIVSIVIAAAAMMLLVLFLRYAPLAPGVQVATLTDSVDAKWADVDSTIEPGARLVTSYTPMLLTEGVAQLLFDKNAEVVIEGPAKFEIMATDQIQLSYGRLFAKVPKEAIGFTVRCETTKVIDLGTEFGVSADLRGGVELHVLKGKTLLFAGDNGGVVSTEVEAGSARKVSSEMTISDIPCNHRIFARAIDPATHTVWRGQKELDMADMVTGGDGLSLRRGLGKLDLLTGQRTGLLFVENPDKNPGFQPVPSTPFIDGVFVPDQGAGEVVSSTGLRFEQCPDTSGTAFYNISTIRDIPVLEEGGANSAEGSHSLALTEKDGSLLGIMLLHPNAGITYDLSAVRAKYTNWQITAFKTGYGFPPALYKKRAESFAGDLIKASNSGTVDLYILVDGQVRRKIAFRMGMAPGTLRIPLMDQDRFLSLVSTDSVKSSNFDWMVLENPKIVLEE